MKTQSCDGEAEIGSLCTKTWAGTVWEEHRWQEQLWRGRDCEAWFDPLQQISQKETISQNCERLELHTNVCNPYNIRTIAFPFHTLHKDLDELINGILHVTCEGQQYIFTTPSLQQLCYIYYFH